MTPHPPPKKKKNPKKHRDQKTPRIKKTPPQNLNNPFKIGMVIQRMPVDLDYTRSSKPLPRQVSTVMDDWDVF